MVFLLGILLIGGHFLLLVSVAGLCAAVLPDHGLPVFLIFSVLSAIWLVRAQTKLEIFFINRHLRKHPNSGWSVMAFAENSRQTRWERSQAGTSASDAPADTGESMDEVGGFAAAVIRTADAAVSRAKSVFAALSAALRQRLQRHGQEGTLGFEQTGTTG